RDRKSRTTHTHRRLGGQIKRALELALGAASDVSLHGVWIVRCEPDPDASRFRVVIRPEDEDDTVLDRLEAARSWLRMEVAHAIHRKRVPDLRFVRAPEEST
ncbi:MAG: ribosome-binding factor A, partial [Myxococcota bacterium]